MDPVFCEVDVLPLGFSQWQAKNFFKAKSMPVGVGYGIALDRPMVSWSLKRVKFGELSWTFSVASPVLETTFKFTAEFDRRMQSSDGWCVTQVAVC